MTYTHALLMIFAATFFPAMISYLIARWIKHERHQRFHEIGIAVFLQIGVIFAVIVAFVFTNVWDQFNQAANAVEREALDLQNIADRAAYLSPDEGAAVRLALARYMRSEVNNEWPAMAHRGISGSTTHAFTALFGAVAVIPTTNALTAGTRESLLHLMRDARDQRQRRLFLMKTNVSAWLWALLISSSVMLVFFVMASGVGHHTVQSLFVGIFAGFLTAILVTIHLFDYPFEGSVRVEPRPISETLEHINDIPVAASPEGVSKP